MCGIAGYRGIRETGDGVLPRMVCEFLKYVFSRLGQEDVLRAGFQPINGRPAEIALDAIGLGGVN